MSALRVALEGLVNRWAVGGNGINAESRDLISACSAELLRVLDEHRAGEYPNGSGSAFLGTTADLDGSAPEPEARYALVEQMGYRHITGTVRETQFCGRPMLELTSLETCAVQLIAPESLYALTWLTRDQAERATRTGAHSPATLSAAIDADLASWDDDDIDPDEGKDDGMSSAERDQYDRESEAHLDALDEERALEREAAETE